MNERIRELKRQAFDAVWDLNNDLIGPGTHYQPDGFEQKFAELIVRECMELTKECSTGSGIHDLFADEIIAEHFGVEE